MTQTDIHIIYTIYYRKVGLLVVAAFKLLDPDIMDKFLDGPQYAKVRYAIHKIYVLLYADNNFYFKKCDIFIKKHNKSDI